MSPIKSKLINQALDLYGAILPCGGDTLEDGFRINSEGSLMLWYNTPDGETHLITEEEINGEQNA